MKFKFLLEQTVWYLKDNRVHSANVLARHAVENSHGDWAHTTEQKQLFAPWGPTRNEYATCHGFFNERELFSSKEDLAASLVLPEPFPSQTENV
jgi:hypothetical protein